MHISMFHIYPIHVKNTVKYILTVLILSSSSTIVRCSGVGVGRTSVDRTRTLKSEAGRISTIRRVIVMMEVCCICCRITSRSMMWRRNSVRWRRNNLLWCRAVRVVLWCDVAVVITGRFCSKWWRCRYCSRFVGWAEVDLHTWYFFVELVPAWSFLWLS